MKSRPYVRESDDRVAREVEVVVMATGAGMLTVAVVYLREVVEVVM